MKEKATAATAVTIIDPSQEIQRDEFSKPAKCEQSTSPKVFLLVIGLYVFFQSMMTSGITSGVITTIEQRYGLRSAESGLVVSSNDIGSLAVILFISYFGGKSHRPRVVAVGAVVTAIGAALFCLPQVLVDSNSGSTGSSGSSISDSAELRLCSASRNLSAMDDENCIDDSPKSNSTALLMFIIANMLMGIGSTPIHTLGTTFLHDSVSKEDASIYIAIFYVVAAVGPAVGFILGGFLLTFHVDLDETSLSSDHPNFIGAWWIGYVISSIAIFITAVFLFMFPKKLNKPEPEVITPLPTPMSPMSPVSPDATIQTGATQFPDTYDPNVISFGKDLKKLPEVFWSLLTNPIYMCVTLSAVLEFSIASANITFVPKYLQSQFGIDTSFANILTGSVLVPAAGLGVMMGGYAIKHFKLNLTGCAFVAAISSTVSTFLFLTVFFISCDPNTVIGHPTGSSTEEMPPLIQKCNDGCSCPSNIGYDPVCLEGKTYFNPCYAGCQSANQSILASYTNCSCADSMDSVATAGECNRFCTSMVAQFLVCLFFITMSTVGVHTPLLLITYRCVTDELRPFAAGLQYMFFRLLAYIPAPIYFGVVIDTACIIWSGRSETCSSDDQGSCLVYNADSFRYIFFGVAFALKFLAVCFNFRSWVLCRKRHSTHLHTTKFRTLKKKKKRLEERKKRTQELNAGMTTAPTSGNAENGMVNGGFQPPEELRKNLSLPLPTTSTTKI